MTAPLLKERWGWTDKDTCWWCEKGRQGGEHLFGGCTAWTKEIRTLWNEVGKASGKAFGIAGEGSGTESDRRRKGPATPQSGTCCQMRGLQAQYLGS